MPKVHSNPEGAPPQDEAELEAAGEVTIAPTAKAKKATWPKNMRELIAAVRNTLGNEAMTLESLAAHFSAPKVTTPLIVEALAALEDLCMVFQKEAFYRLAS